MPKATIVTQRRPAYPSIGRISIAPREGEIEHVLLAYHCSIKRVKASEKNQECVGANAPCRPGFSLANKCLHQLDNLPDQG